MKTQLRITFKNVGQGDCILLEWKDKKGKNQLGIIDCNQVNGDILSLRTHLRDLGTKEIKFIILSHPHSDHYSGMLKLLAYCDKENIGIERIYHTAVFDKNRLTTNAFFNSIVPYDFSKKKNLKELFSKFKQLNDRKDCKTKVYFLVNDSLFPFTTFSDGLIFRSLSPVSKEHDLYFSETFTVDGKRKIQEREENPNANLLSTVLLIESENWQILLTSDVTKAALERLGEDFSEELEEKPLVVLQIPHHGSVKNHVPDFWRNTKTEKAAAFISAGLNWRYKHPAQGVVAFFDEHASELHCTNSVHGYKAYFDKKNGISDTNSYQGRQSKMDHDLDLVALPVIIETSFTRNNCGEKIVDIYEDGTYNVTTI